MTNISKLGQEFGQYLIQLMGELMLRSSEQPRSLSEMERKHPGDVTESGPVSTE